MARIPYERRKIQGNTLLFIYGPIANGDYLAPLDLSDYSDKTVHVYGTFGAGGSLTLFGSNNPDDAMTVPDPVTGSWAPIEDSTGNAITKTSKSLEALVPNADLISGLVTAGDSNTALYVAIKARRAG
jgi:hypothetical protein